MSHFFPLEKTEMSLLLEILKEKFIFILFDYSSKKDHGDLLIWHKILHSRLEE